MKGIIKGRTEKYIPFVPTPILMGLFTLSSDFRGIKARKYTAHLFHGSLDNTPGYSYLTSITFNKCLTWLPTD